MTDTSKDSTADHEYEKSILTAHAEGNIFNLSNAGNQLAPEALHGNHDLKTLRRSERIRQRRAQESEESRKERLQRDAARHRLHRLQESEQQTQERRRKGASRERQRREQETNEERHERQVEDASRARQRRGQETNEQRHERQVEDASRVRQRREQETNEQRYERQVEDASRARQQRQQETGEERRERQLKNASRERQRRQQETDEERRERQEKNASREKRRREQETDDEQLERQVKNAFRQRRRRQQSSSLYAAALRDEFPSESYHGRMDNICQHCNALHFKEECTSDRHDEFKQCCHYGSVQLPELLPYPDEIKTLLQGTDVESKHFRENIRSYNSALAFASMGAEIDLPQGFGPYCFRIHGQIYHRIGPLNPGPGQRAQFRQLYILDSSLALKERMGNAANENCNETTMSKLGDIMKRISPYAAAYKMMHEVEQEEIDRAKREKRAPPPLRMIFDINRGIHDRRLYNLPTANEVAAVFVGEDSEVPTYRHIAIHPRGQRWYPELEKTDQSRNRKRVSMLQFYSYRLAICPTFSAIQYGGKLFQQYIVDAYVKTEQNRLEFHRQNQKALRVELYQGLMDHLANEAETEGLRPGRVIILPSSFQGSPRAMQQNYQDATAIVR
ncbi:unnamed protein product [Rotaria sordida]|uniref:Helitron helicase-like domain-containing protein n=1 Tax=Rotaria sordida TaxID=392033 RepID=A0A815MBQ0_9BILA|nr:unnamed protein product [Rotaria sordida]CAF1420351.1 unnamed protein product [Rotaria sordida]